MKILADIFLRNRKQSFWGKSMEVDKVLLAL
ncbi:hypothetical protein PBAL39_02282 [Pedobacter sp. BAL39]|nr:hypothetical protein PBAL39_02282 [Pedobacter sp. BAL39]